MAYFDLAVEGIARLRRMAPLAERPIAWEALGGLVDGTNNRFRARHSPVKPNTLTAYVGGVSVSATLTAPDMVLLAAAPVAQPYASYIHQPLSDLQAKQLLMDGVTELEMRWPRGWRMSSSAASYVAAAESDTHIYVLDQDSVADPYGEVYLSESETQKGLVIRCAHYVYRLADVFRAAQAAVSVRGSAGGMTLDRRAIPTALLQALAVLDLRLKQQLVRAQSQWTGGESLGGALDPVMTRDYLNNYEWQTSSILEDWYSLYRYQPSDVDLEAIT